MLEMESHEKFKAVHDLMHEMVEMWQRVKDLEASDRDHRQEIEALRASDARLRCVIEKLPLRFFFKDSALNYVLCSDAYALDWDMKPDELTGKSDRDLFTAEVVEKLANVEYDVIHTGRMEIAEEDRLVAGREITVLAIRKPIINGTGATLGLLCVLWDITQDKKLKSSLQSRIHELEGALSERVGQVESLKSQLEAALAEHREKAELFSRLRQDLEAEIAVHEDEIQRKIADHAQKEQEFGQQRARLEGEIALHKDEIQRKIGNHAQKEQEFDQQRALLEGEIASHKNEIQRMTADHAEQVEKFDRLRAEMETEVLARREEIHRLRNELQKEMFERGQAVEALKKSITHSQELLDSVQKTAGAE
ncbi:MAG TPA: PAS domain S-box protein [Syntrophales bacterium]|nr:PAS domain S-box protein [Syntrophales bacterium]